MRANETFAAPSGGDGSGAYLLTGHKWFTSAPMSDGFLTLAVTEKGAPPTCFLVPRVKPDGARNIFQLQRLKEKIGDRSNASSEVEYRGTWARMIGKEGRGVSVIIEMVNHTRLSCVLGSAGVMRRAALEAVHHCSHRSAFGKVLANQPVMRAVLADVALESEAAVATGMYLCALFDQHPGGGKVGRLATTVAKYFVCKREVNHVYEALECFGGNGFVEDFPMARLYRQAPLNAIWEGSGNVIALDILRALAKEPDAVDAFLAALGKARGCSPAYDTLLSRATAILDSGKAGANIEPRARALADMLGTLLQTLALTSAPTVPPAVAQAFIDSRLANAHGPSYGSHAFTEEQARTLIERATLLH